MSTTKHHIQPSSTEGQALGKGLSATSLSPAPPPEAPQPEVPPSFHTNGPPNCSQPFPNWASDDVLVRLKALEQENQQLRDEKQALREEIVSLRVDNASLRKENAAIRDENTRLRNRGYEQPMAPPQPLAANTERNPEKQYYNLSAGTTMPPSPQRPTSNPFTQEDNGRKKTYRKPHADRVPTPEEYESAQRRKQCLNPKYKTRRAVRFWDALIDAHLVDENYQPLIPRSQMGEIAYCLSQLDTTNNKRTDWKEFERLWGLHNLCADWRRGDGNDTADLILQLFYSTAD